MFLLVIFALISFVWSRQVLTGLAVGLELVFTGVFLYSLGGFIRKYNPFEKVRTWVVVAIIIGINLIVCGNYYITTANKIMAFNPASGEVFTQSIPSYGNHQLIPIVLGIAIFELFRRIKLPYCRIINYLGASTLMVFLFHNNSFISKIWGITDWVTLLHDDMLLFIATFLLWTLGTFGVGVVLYTVYIFIGKLLQACKPFVMKSEE